MKWFVLTASTMFYASSHDVFSRRDTLKEAVLDEEHKVFFIALMGTWTCGTFVIANNSGEGLLVSSSCNSMREKENRWLNSSREERSTLSRKRNQCDWDPETVGRSFLRRKEGFSKK